MARILQLALALDISNTAAITAASHLPKFMHPVVAHGLMIIAATQGHGWLAHMLSCKPDVQWLISADELETVLKHLMTQDNNIALWDAAQKAYPQFIFDNLTCAKLLLNRQLPAAAGLTGDAVSELLHVAAQRGSEDCMPAADVYGGCAWVERQQQLHSSLVADGRGAWQLLVCDVLE
jgi:hypothetical protein